jgi:hypothetical protein
MRMRDVSVISGRRACYAAMTRMVETGSKYFWISGGGNFADRLANMPILLGKIKAADERGIDVRVFLPHGHVLRGPLALMDAGRERPLLHHVNVNTLGPLVSCVTEDVCFETISQPDDDAPSRGDDVAIQIADPQFAAKLRQRLEASVADPAFVPITEVYPWLGPNHGSDIFGDAIDNATSEVQVLGSAQWGAHMRATWAQAAPAYAAAVKRGVTLRVVASRDAATDTELKDFQAHWNVRLADELPMWMAIVDGKVLHQAFPHASLGGQPQFRRSEELHEIQFYQGIFDRLWNEAAPLVPLPASPANVPVRSKTIGDRVGQA